MGSITNYLETALLNHVFNDTAYTPAATLYLALATANPGEAATGASMSEVANANGYSRKALTCGASASRAIANSAAVTFDPATGSWGTVTHWAIADSATHGAGNALAYGSLVTSKAVVNGNEPSVAIGEVVISVATGGASNWLANGLLDFAFRNQAFAAPATHVGWSTVNLTDATTGSKVTEPAAGYARVSVLAAGWNTAVSGDPSFVANGADVEFPAATGAQGTVTAGFIATAGTAGEIIAYSNAIAEQVVGDTDVVVFRTPNLRVRFTNPA